MFATKTKVPIAQTKGEIRAVLGKYGATQYRDYALHNSAVVMFESQGHLIRMNLPLSHHWATAPFHTNEAQQARSRWRSLLLCIKAKLQSIYDGIETFEEAFLPHIVGDDDLTIGQRIIPTLKAPQYREQHCPHCGTLNRIPHSKRIADASCGRCHKPLHNEGPPILMGPPFSSDHPGP